MRKTERLLLAIAISTLSVSAFAHGGGASGGGHQAIGPASGSHALANSNGRFALDRDKGLDRAEDRSNALRHEKGWGHHERHHRHAIHATYRRNA